MVPSCAKAPHFAGLVPTAHERSMSCCKRAGRIYKTKENQLSDQLSSNGKVSRRVYTYVLIAPSNDKILQSLAHRFPMLDMPHILKGSVNSIVEKKYPF